jgi:hypothetical protein
MLSCQLYFRPAAPAESMLSEFFQQATLRAIPSVKNLAYRIERCCAGILISGLLSCPQHEFNLEFLRLFPGWKTIDSVSSLPTPEFERDHNLIAAISVGDSPIPSKNCR